MQDQPSSAGVERDFDRAERAVLILLLDRDRLGLWSVAEIGRAIGCQRAASEAVVGLQAAGLVHRVHEFVFVSLPAARFDQLTRV